MGWSRSPYRIFQLMFHAKFLALKFMLHLFAGQRHLGQGHTGARRPSIPFSIIHRVVQKWIQDKAFGMLIAPFWPTKPWFIVLSQLICGIPITFGIKADKLILPFACSEDLNPTNSTCSQSLAGRLPVMTVFCQDDHFGNKVLTMTSSSPCSLPSMIA